MEGISLSDKLRAILKQFWGYDDFRPGQLEIATSVVNNRQTLTILTTGGGKSICFQVPGLYLPGLTLVISPLISLMQDQVGRLKSLSIAAAFYNSQLDKSEKQKLKDAVFAGQVKFLYIAPESLRNRELQLLLNRIHVGLVAVDEAHCISIWGHDFRPSYLQIPEFLRGLENPPRVAAFTGTATPEVRQDISKYLRFDRPKVFLNSFLRANMSLNVLVNQDQSEFENLLRDRLAVGPALVYSSSRARTEQLAQILGGKRIKAAAYHAGMSKEARENVLQAFLGDELQLVVATNAFGMGVDKGNVYTVIHESLPDSLENYYQEVGRGGRDGAETVGYLNFSWRGANLRERMLQNNYIDSALANNFYNFMRKHVGRQKLPIGLVIETIEGLNPTRLGALIKIFNDSEIFSGLKINAETSEFLVWKTLKPNILFLGRHIDFAKEQRLYDAKSHKLKAMLLFCHTDNCRMQFLLGYFGEKYSGCGKCDNCRQI